MAREPRSWYDKFCRTSEALGINPPKFLREKLKENITFSGLHVSPKGVFSGSILGFILALLISLIPIFFITDITIRMVVLVFPFGVLYYLYTYPAFQAQVLRVQAGDESIKIILYMSIYLKQNPSLERAVNFAAAHAKGPITEDIKKAMWDLEVGKYKTVEEALGVYIPKWVVWNEDFVRALTLIYGVLKEPKEEERDRILKKSLDFLLETTHVKMKTYVEDITGPLRIIHILGIMLPVMGLIMFPMVSLFLHESISIPFIAIAYVILLPILNFFLVTRILMKRPSAFMVPDISKHPDLPPKNMFALKIGKNRIWIPVLPLAILAGLLLMIPGIIHFSDLFIKMLASPVGSAVRQKLILAEAEMSLENLIATFSITTGFAAMVILYFYLKSFQRIRIRNDIKNIEAEFRLGLYTLGNYLSEGYSIETSVQKSLDEYIKLGMQKRPVYSFFSMLLGNIKKFGMTFKKAIFDPAMGIIKYYPSILINEILKILSDASPKSSVLAGKISKTMAGYLESLDRIEAKIKELLEDVRSGIKLEASFIVPLLLGVVSSLGIFLINMLKILAEKLAGLEKSLGLGMMAGGTQGFSNILESLIGDFTKVTPMTALQAIIGMYTVEAVIILSYLLNGVENGFDEVARDYTISQNVLRAVIIYGIVSIMTLGIFRLMQLSLTV